MDFVRLEKLAESHMNNRRSHRERETGFVFLHGKRVMNGALNLRRLITDDTSFDDVLACAALFHDVGKGIGEHGKSGAAIARYILKDEITPDELDTVARLIEAHNKRDPEGDKWDMPAKLLQDADLLDHYGVMEVWLNFHYNAYHDWNFEKAQEFYRDEFEKDVAKHMTLLNYEISKQIFEEKAAFSRSVFERMQIEGAGNYIGV